MFPTKLNYLATKSNRIIERTILKWTRREMNQLALKEIPLKERIIIDEVKVPFMDGYIAGKLWQGKPDSSISNKVPILCMHGWLDNAGSFDPLLPLILQPNMTAISIDFPGHGFSSNSFPMHYDAHIECMMAMKAIMHHYRWDKVIILGHSLGSIVGFVFAAVFPELVDRYIALENVRPIPRNSRKELRYSINKLLELQDKGSRGISPPNYTYDQIIKKFYEGRGGTISEEGCKVLMRRGAVQLSNNLFKFSHDPKAIFPTGLWRFSPEQTEEFARNIECPVCFIKGEPGGDYEPRSNYLQIVNLMKTKSKRVEYHQVPGTHHFHLNDPISVANIIAKFLRS